MFENSKEVLTVKEACIALSMGHNTLYRLLKQGNIKSIKVGKKYYIPKVFLIDYINSFK